MMIENKSIKYNFSECNETELQILSKYWDSDNEGNFKMKLSEICTEFELTISNLYSIASRYPLYWINEPCEDCGVITEVRIEKRKEFISRLNSYAFYNFEYYKKCPECNSAKSQRERNSKYEDEMFYTPVTPSDLLEDQNNEISQKIKSLYPFEIKLLYQIYQIKNFNLIKNSSEIFPVKYGEHKRFVWRSLYKFDTLNLITADKTGSFIKDIHFHDNISELLDHMIGELEPFIEQIDMELSLLRIKEGNINKYFSILQPETDIILKTGHEYEFIAKPTTDKNMILRVININPSKSSSNFEFPSGMNKNINDNPFYYDEDSSDDDNSSVPF